MSAGNLSTHLRKLEDANYVQLTKTYQRRTPVTYVCSHGPAGAPWRTTRSTAPAADPSKRPERPDRPDRPARRLKWRFLPAPCRRRGVTPVIALDGVSLDVPAGQLLGLLGPNGAGKSTVLQLLAGLRRPSSGAVELFGGDHATPPAAGDSGAPPGDGLPPTLRVHEVVDFVAGHFADPVPTAESWSSSA